MSEKEPNINNSGRPRTRLTRADLIVGTVAFSGAGSLAPEEEDAEIRAMNAARESLRGKPPIHKPREHQAYVRDVQDALRELRDPNNPNGLYTRDDVNGSDEKGGTTTPPSSQS